MITTKQDFVKTFLPNSCNCINFAQIDLDISDLSIADVLRNINTTFPQNSRARNKIANGENAVGIICKSELLEPLSGLLLIITDGEENIQIVSKNYVVIGIGESDITNDDDIKKIIDSITKYMIASFKDSFEDFNEFYIKYIYDEHELEMEQDTDNEYFN